MLSDELSSAVEAWLADNRLVLGAGALTVFGQAELPALLAFALALGPAGAKLRDAGPVPGFVAAAVNAFAAYPASLALCRVVALLDDDARGTDPSQVDVASVLRASEAFSAIAHAALESLS